MDGISRIKGTWSDSLIFIASINAETDRLEKSYEKLYISGKSNSDFMTKIDKIP